MYYIMHTYQGDTYFTVHVTPQTECSWVSFETNLEKESYSSLISQVLSLFRPGKCAVSLFASKVSKYACTQVAVASFQSFSTHAREKRGSLVSEIT